MAQPHTSPLPKGYAQSRGKRYNAPYLLFQLEAAVGSNLDVARGLYAAFADGNIPGVLGALAATIEWTEAAGGPYGGVSVGTNAVLDNVFMKIGDEWEGFSAVPSEFVEQGPTVIALGEYSGTYKATGKSFSAPFAHVWKFAEGKAISYNQYTDTALHLQPMQA